MSLSKLKSYYNVFNAKLRKDYSASPNLIKLHYITMNHIHLETSIDSLNLLIFYIFYFSIFHARDKIRKFIYEQSKFDFESLSWVTMWTEQLIQTHLEKQSKIENISKIFNKKNKVLFHKILNEGETPWRKFNLSVSLFSIIILVFFFYL